MHIVPLSFRYHYVLYHQTGVITDTKLPMKSYNQFLGQILVKLAEIYHRVYTVYSQCTLN
jgi:hypothetical protein